MQTISQAAELQAACDSLRAAGRRIAFVPTMGYLHRGHLSLVEAAKQQADHCVVSIFVNPKQFAAGEDLDRYPSDIVGDSAKCADAGVDVLFLPSYQAIYPPGFQTEVSLPKLARDLCGHSRPEHFAGVCTVVARLFGLVGPCVALFGQKDYQQLAIIRRMTEDLCLPVTVVGRPTVREPDGLAMSSRNAYLDAEQRQLAPRLFAALTAAAERLRLARELPVELLCQLVRDLLEPFSAFEIDYVAVRRRSDLAPLEVARAGQVVMLLAARLGRARLIDNLEL